MGSTDKNNGSNNFSDLAKTISKQERQDILNKMNSTIKKGEGIKNSVEKDIEKEKNNTIQHIKRESLIKRIILHLTALFSSSTVEEVYLEGQIKKIARSLEWDFPNVINYKRRVLSSAFHDKLNMLKDAAAFFAPYAKSIDSNMGAFYYSLAKVLIPEVIEKAENESNPYNHSFATPITETEEKAMRASITRCMKEISQEKIHQFFACAKMIYWIKDFADFQFDKMLSKFTLSAEGTEVSLFSMQRDKLKELSQIMCNYDHIESCIPEAIILFMQNNNESSSIEELDKFASSVTSFRVMFQSQISIIEMFIKSIPMETLCKVVLEDALFVPEPFSGGENWHDILSTVLRKKFELNLKYWQRDLEKDKLKQKLNEYLQLDNFPLFPFRPWDKLWEGIRFSYNYSIGLIYYFMNKNLEKLAVTLKGITMEGDFAIRENLHHTGQALEKMEQINSQMEKLAADMTATGEFGFALSRYDSYEKTPSAISNVNVIMASIDKRCETIVKQFVTWCGEASGLFTGFISLKPVGDYGALLNLREIVKLGDLEGTLKTMSVELSHYYELAKSLQTLETPEK